MLVIVVHIQVQAVLMLGQGIQKVDMANYFKGLISVLAVLFGQMYLQLKAPLNCI
jgi:hypothetical protein